MSDIIYIQKKILEVVNANIENEKINLVQFEDDLSQLGMESIMFITIVVEIEEMFKIEIPDEYLLISEMNTITKMAEVVKETIAIKELNQNIQ